MPISIPASSMPDKGAAIMSTFEPPSKPAALFDLTGQVALVTGASRGLGWAVAQCLAGAGATIILNGRDPATLSGRKDQLNGCGLAADIAPFDVSDRDAVAAAIEQIASRFG